MPPKNPERRLPRRQTRPPRRMVLLKLSRLPLRPLPTRARTEVVISPLPLLKTMPRRPARRRRRRPKRQVSRPKTVWIR